MSVSDQNQNIEVVISGISGYFPKSQNVEEFEKLLFNHENFLDTARWKNERYDACDLTGNVEQIDLFDASFFGVHSLQTLHLDPMSRMSLENSFSAIIDAGMNPMEIRDKRVGVHVACTLNENESIMFDIGLEHGFGITGQARTMIANRISYYLNATGPSATYENNWVGGIQAFQNGYEAIKMGECEASIVVGVNLVNNICTNYIYKQLEFLNPDGKTRPFDDDANGYSRSEAIIVLFLQRADAALRHYATIVDADLIFNGHRSGQLSALKLEPARLFLTNFYQNVNVNPADVQYIEAYGAALKPIDELELNLLDDVFNKERPHDQPLLVGSIKSNMGHAEGAAPLVSIIKTLIAMEKYKIPANLHYKTGNRNIKALRDGRIKIVTENTSWSGTLAAINCFGLLSSFGHILLKSNSSPCVKQNKKNEDKLPELFVLSTRNENGMREILNKVKDTPLLSDHYMHMINRIFTKNISGHMYRGYIVRNTSGVVISDEIEHFEGRTRPLWFVYSGMGSQWLGMGRTLLQLPIFAASIAQCQAALAPHGIDIYQIINSTEYPKIFDNIINCFVGIAAIQIGLTDVMFALGLRPDNMIGHSVGELGCAYADGALTIEQTMLCAYYRGCASREADLVPGLMAAVGLGAGKAKSLCPDDVDVACHNGPESCTLSGPIESMQNLVGTIQRSGIFARLVNVAGIAYHSRYIKPAAPILLKYLKTVITNPKLRSSKWLSTSVAEENSGWNTDLAKYASPEYMTNNLLSCVRFEEVLKHIPKDAVLIEIAPHGLLQAILKRSLPADCTNIALARRDEQNSIDLLLKSIGQLYLTGLSPIITNLYKHTNEVETVCPRGTPSLSPLVKWSHSETWKNMLQIHLNKEKNEITYCMEKTNEHFQNLIGHRVKGISKFDTNEDSIVVPIISYLPLVWNQLCKINELKNIIFQNVHLMRHRILPDKNITSPPVHVMVQRGSEAFEINDQFGIIAKGSFIIHELTNLTSTNRQQYNLGKKIDELNGEDFYRELTNRGHRYKGEFLAVNALEIYNNGMKAKIEWRSGWELFVAAMLQLVIFREGQTSRRALDVTFIHSLSVKMSDERIPTDGDIFDVVYNYSTSTIYNSFISIHGPSCDAYQKEPSRLIAQKYYSTEIIKKSQHKIDVNKRDFKLDNKKEEEMEFVLSEENIRHHLPDINVHCVGLNTSTVVVSSQNKLDDIVPTEEAGNAHQPNPNEIGVINYCGTEKASKRRVMGIAQVNKTNLIVDPILRWDVPNSWSKIDGATVPLAYTIAYYVLNELVSVTPNKIILIHNGCSSIGQAMITVARNLSYVVFATVGSLEQRKILIESKQLKDENIFYYTSNNFQQQVMAATRSAPINVLIDCLLNIQLEPGLKCTYIIKIQNEYPNREELSDTIGMSIFLRCYGMHALKLSRIFNLPNDVKRRLHKYVLNGINEEHVVPLRTVMFQSREQQKIQHILSYLTDPLVTGTVVLPFTEPPNLKSNNTLQEVPDNSTYIIYGDDDNIDNLITTINWMATSLQVKTLTVLFSSSNKKNKKYLLYGLTAFKLNHSHIDFKTLDVSSNSFSTGLQQLNNQNISGAIIFSKDGKILKQINDKLRDVRIVLMSCVTNINKSNLEQYHPDEDTIKNVSLLCWEKKRQFVDVVEFLGQAIKEVVDIFVHRENEDDVDEMEVQDACMLFKDFCSLLSKSVASITKWSLPEVKTTVKLATTNSPRVPTECPPVFLVPGLLGEQCSHLAATLKQLMYPVYLLDSSYENITLEELAVHFGREVRSIYPTGPYNLIGVSSGGSLAIELAKHLENNHAATVQLYLVDGSPYTMQQLVADAAFIHNQQNSYEIILLQQLLNIDESIISLSPNWDDRVKAATRHISGKNRLVTERMLHCFKRRLDAVLTHSSTAHYFNGITRLLLASDSSEDNLQLMNHCKQVKTEIIKGNHFTILQNNNLVEFINKHLIVPPLYI